MLNSLNSGVAGLRNFQAKLDVIGNNIANSNTIGYKAAHTNFEDTFSQTLQGGSKAIGELQIGSGMQVSSIKNDFSAGTYQQTGNESNLYINGSDGFFVVKNSDTGEEFATRAGDFTMDKQGYLVTNEGYRLQGYTNEVASGGAMSTLGDVRVNYDPTNPPAGLTPGSQYAGYKIDTDGRIKVTLDNNQTYDSGQVLLQTFTDVNMLTKEGNNLYSNLNAAGPAGGTVDPSIVPGSSGTGKLKSGALEMSNVDLAGEFADLISTQRGFQANARIITTSDEILQEVVNLKR
jgi:flagellar hook protein FlgE